MVLTAIHAREVFAQDLGRVVPFPAKKFEKRMKISFLLGESENMKATGIVRRIDDCVKIGLGQKP